MGTPEILCVSKLPPFLMSDLQDHFQIHDHEHITDPGALGPKGFLINVARGSVVDQPALIQALKSKSIAGAGLDVYIDEPRVVPELRALDNVVLTPHMASGTMETRRAMANLALMNLQAHFSNQPLLTPIPECPPPRE